MEKIQRNQMAHFLRVGTKFVRLGRDLEEYQPKIKAKVEKTRNILGQTGVQILGYEKQGTVAPYYARKDDPLFTLLQHILDSGMESGTCRAAMLEAKLWLTENGTCPAVLEECLLEITSYGGDTTGYQISFNIHYTGARQHGTFNTITEVFLPELEIT